MCVLTRFVWYLIWNEKIVNGTSITARLALRFTHESWFGYPITGNSTSNSGCIWTAIWGCLTNQNLLFTCFQSSIFNGRHFVTDALDILIDFLQSIRKIICLFQVRLHIFLRYLIDYVKELENVMEIIKKICVGGCQSLLWIYQYMFIVM